MSSEKAKRGLYSNHPFVMESVSEFDLLDPIGTVAARLTDKANPALDGLEVRLSTMDDDYQFFVEGAGHIGGMLEQHPNRGTRVTLVQQTQLLRYVWLMFGMLVVVALLTIFIRIWFLTTMGIGAVGLIALVVFEATARQQFMRRVKGILSGK
jgi:hypothetical protein